MQRRSSIPTQRMDAQWDVDTIGWYKTLRKRYDKRPTHKQMHIMQWRTQLPQLKQGNYLEEYGQQIR